MTNERLRERQANVAQARAAFLPSLDVNFLYTPDPGVAGSADSRGYLRPDEQTFRANMIRENVIRFDVSQPIYTGGTAGSRVRGRGGDPGGHAPRLERARRHAGASGCTRRSTPR